MPRADGAKDWYSDGTAMATRTCARHPDREAPTACFQCKTPVCAACTVMAPHGSFCSAECGVLYRAFREKPPEDPLLRKAGWAGKAVAAVFLVLVLFVAVHAAAERGFKPARAVDLLGRLFAGLDVLKGRGTPR
jgi:hypothetical protein